MLSDILPTGFECGVVNGKVAPGSTVAIVGAGPIGLAALLTAQFYSPAQIIMIDLDDRRLQAASRFGATQIVNSADGKAAEKVKALTGGLGVDAAIEAVGVPATFLLCQDIVAPGGIIANVGVHGTKLISTWSAYGRKISPSPRDSSTPSPRLCCSKPCSHGSSIQSRCSRIGSNPTRSSTLTIPSAMQASTGALKVIIEA